MRGACPGSSRCGALFVKAALRPLNLDPHPAIPAPIGLIVIEDDEDDFLLLVRKLRSAGLPVSARRVQTAVELGAELAVGSCDAVISDHLLPRFSSLEALELVRRHDPDLPFLIVSGAIGEERAVEAMRAGADDYLMKDKLGRLVPALERALTVAATRRAQRTAEAALIESKTRFGALTANLPGMVFQLLCKAGELSLLYVSEGSRRVLGMAPDDVRGSPELLFNALATDEGAMLRAALLENPPMIPFVQWSGALRASTDHQPRWIEFAARARSDASGAVLWDGIVSDVSEQKRAQQELHELASHLTHVREQEREAIAREIHDDVGSTLTAVKFELAWLKSEVKHLPRASEKLREVDQLVDAVILSSSRIMHNLRPGILDEGIVASLEWQARAFERRMAIPCSFHASHDDIALGGEQAIALFRVCQEALNNVAKHASASRVDIRLDADGHSLLLEIADDGKGIGGSDLGKRTCFGLRGMRERAHSLGGTIDIASEPGRGTTISVTAPLRNAPDGDSHAASAEAQAR